MGKRILIVTVILVLIASTANAQTRIYRHVDSDGRITYANKPMKGANKLQVGAHSTKAIPVTMLHTTPSVVHNQTQKKRDIKRRQILENELALEIKLLATAKQKLNQAKNSSGANLAKSKGKPDNQIKEINQVQTRISLHERNIGALNKELASL